MPSVLILGYDIFKIIRLFVLKKKLKGYQTENQETIEQIENEKRQEIINNQINNNVIQIVKENEPVKEENNN